MAAGKTLATDGRQSVVAACDSFVDVIYDHRICSYCLCRRNLKREALELKEQLSSQSMKACVFFQEMTALYLAAFVFGAVKGAGTV